MPGKGQLWWNDGGVWLIDEMTCMINFPYIHSYNLYRTSSLSIIKFPCSEYLCYKHTARGENTVFALSGL